MGVSLTQILADKSNVPLGKNATPIKEKGLVYVAEGLPPLPAKIVEIIEKGEFIDFVELLPKHPILEDQSVTELSENIVVISHSRQLTKKKVIKDIETWMEAFCTFAAVRAKKYPLTIPDLLAYGATIVKGARDYGGQQWLAYDYRFRQLAAARQLESGWGHKDMALWNDTFLHPKKEKSKDTEGTDRYLPSKRRPADNLQALSQKRQKKDRPWKGQVFSYNGKCTRERCEYLHVCYDCGGGHPQPSCPKKTTQQ